jgi:hypothetical protein
VTAPTPPGPGAPAAGPLQGTTATTPWLAGSLACLPCGEVLEVLGLTLRSGELSLTVVSGGAAQAKTIWLREGQVIFAASSDPSDHLGAVLWRRGLVPLETLDRLSPRVGPDRPLGQVLVDERLLTPAALYDALVVQVREIALGAFHEREGVFVFRQGEPAPGANAVQLPERIRDLVAAGARRLADVERLVAEVPDPDAPLTLTGLPPRGLDERAARLVRCAADGRTVREAFRASGLGFYEGVKVLAALARARLVTGPPARPAAAAAAIEEDAIAEDARAVEPLETYRRIFKRIFFRLAHATPAARDRLNSWFDRLPAPDRAVFEGVRMGPEGEVDVARVLVNVFAAGRDEGPAARARALGALDAFLAFAMFEAKNVLPRDDAESLAREVARMAGRRER